MTRFLICCLACLPLTACNKKAEPANPAPTAADAKDNAANPASSAAAPDLLVFSQSTLDGNLQTTWIKAGDTDGSKARRIEKEVFAAGDQVFAIEEQEVEYEGPNCECAVDDEDEDDAPNKAAKEAPSPSDDCPQGAKSTQTLKIQQYSLKNLVSGLTIPLNPLESLKGEDGKRSSKAEISDVVNPVALFGPYLQLETCRTTGDCKAAHPDYSCSASLVDLRKFEVVDPKVLDLEAQKASVAFDKLTWEPSGLDGDDFEPHFEVVSLKSAITANGFTLLFKAKRDTCGACSDGEWSRSTTTALSPISPLPAPLDQLAAVNVSEIPFKAFADQKIIGISKVSADEKTQAALKAYFDQAAIPTK